MSDARLEPAAANGEARPATPPLAVSDRSTLVNKTGSWKYMYPEYHDRIAPCNAGCPVGIDIEGYMSLLRDGRIDEACDLLLRENPMPAVTGRVCDHPCELQCNRGNLDGAVAIHAVERMLGDRVLASPPPPSRRRRRERVAVVGSGPAGLACAHHLARLGYGVDVFERDAEAGGMLRQGIPTYRLPRDVLDGTIERMEAGGVRIRCNAGIGTTITWGELTSAFDAIFLGVGAHVGRRLGVPGEDLPGVRQGLDFLRAVNRGERVRIGSAAARRVVVIGGGNTAMDCARTALRLAGAGAKVTVLYRRTRNEMPAIAEEVLQAEREGVELAFLAAPASFEKRGGRLAVVCTPMRLGDPDARGRRRPEPSGEKAFRIMADGVLLAIGEDVALTGFPAELSGRDAVRADEWGRAQGVSGTTFVSAGGDVTGGDRTVAHALGAGKRAAIGIDRYLRTRRGDAPAGPAAESLRFGEQGSPSMARWTDDDPIQRVAPVNTVVKFEELNVAHFARIARHADRETHVTRGAARFAEVNRGLDDDTALKEAGRCLQCGVCNSCELCMIFCADVAIRRGNDGDRFDIDLDYCKGCGVCAAECPRGALTMTRDAGGGAAT